MGKIIVDNSSDLGDNVAMQLVKQVIELGRVSDDGKQYCYVTTFNVGSDTVYAVATHLNKKSDKFFVYNYGGFKINN